MRRNGSAASKARARVVLPAPEGEDSTNRRPRRARRAVCWLLSCPLPSLTVRSLDVLRLLAHLVDDRLELKASPRRLRIVRFRAQCVGLAIELLAQEIEAPAGWLSRGHELTCTRDVGAQALQLFLHIGPRRQHGRLLVKTPFVEGSASLHQPPDLLLQPLADRLGRAGRRLRHPLDEALDGGDLLEHNGAQVPPLRLARPDDAVESLRQPR